MARTIRERVVALGRMSAEVCRAESEEEALVAAGRHVHELFRADWVGVELRSADGRQFRQVVLPSDGDSLESSTELPAGGLVMDKAPNESAVVVDDVARTPHRDLNGLSAVGMRSALIVPLRSGPYAIGALVIASRMPSSFNDDDQHLAGHASAFLTSAIVNLRSIAGVQDAEAERHKAERLLARRASEQDLLRELLAAASDDYDSNADGGLATAGVLGELATRVASGFLSLRGIDLCRVSEIDDLGSVRIVAAAAEKGARFGDEGPVLHASSPEGIANATGELSLWRQPSPYDLEASSMLESLGATSLVAVPIIGNGVCMGTLTLASVGQNRHVTDEHIMLASIVAKRLGVAIVERRYGLRERRRRALAPARELAQRLSTEAVVVR
ncbi:MAG: GAF domain-containing protein [Acidimicrobiales bacterium]